MRIEAAHWASDYFAADLVLLRTLNTLPAGATWFAQWKVEAHRSMMSCQKWQVSAAQCGWYLYADAGIVAAVLRHGDADRSRPGAAPAISSSELTELVLRSHALRTGKLSLQVGGN